MENKDITWVRTGPSTVIHEHKDTRYRMVIERSAVKGVLGYKVEANGDLLTCVIEQVKVLKDAAELITVEEVQHGQS